MEIHHHTMIRLADFPLLEQLARNRSASMAKRLDSRACRWLYERELPNVDLASTSIQPDERNLIESLGLSALLER